MPKITYSEEKLREAIDSNNTIAGVLRTLSLKDCGGNYSTIKAKIRDLKIDCSHFVGQAWKANSFRPLEELRCKVRIKQYLLRTRGHTCNECKLSTWNGKPIPIEVDHIDGDNQNNTETNLRLLCPNCHAQTATYRGKNIKPR